MIHSIWDYTNLMAYAKWSIPHSAHVKKDTHTNIAYIATYLPYGLGMRSKVCQFDLNHHALWDSDTVNLLHNGHKPGSQEQATIFETFHFSSI